MKRYLTTVLLICFTYVLSPSTVEASVLYTLNEPFNSPSGGLPTSWASRVTGATSTIEIGEISPASGDRRLILRRDAGASQQTVFYTGSEGPIESGIMTHFESSVTLRLNVVGSAEIKGLLGRTSETSDPGEFNGYYAYITTTTTGSSPAPASISISKGLINNNSVGSLLTSQNLTENLVAGVDYQFSFSIVGDQLSASIYKQAGEVSVLLGELSIADSTYTSGLFGFRNKSGGSDRAAYFSDLELKIIAIPEPSAAALGAVGTGWLALFLKRRRSLRRKEPSVPH